MRIKCPNCGIELPPRNVSLATGWAKCDVCNEIFALADVKGYQPRAAAPAIERPFDACAKVLRMPQQLGIVIPPEGMRAGTWGVLAFATVWLTGVGIWTYLVIRNGGKGFALFSILHWGIGFLLLGIVLLQSRASFGVYLDANQMAAELRCLFWRHRWFISREKVQGARRSAGPLKGDKGGCQPDHVEIVYENGSFTLRSNSTAEQAWLIGEINDFLKSTPIRDCVPNSPRPNNSDGSLSPRAMHDRNGRP